MPRRDLLGRSATPLPTLQNRMRHLRRLLLLLDLQPGLLLPRRQPILPRDMRRRQKVRAGLWRRQHSRRRWLQQHLHSLRRLLLHWWFCHKSWYLHQSHSQSFDLLIERTIPHLGKNADQRESQLPPPSPHRLRQRLQKQLQGCPPWHLHQRRFFSHLNHLILHPQLPVQLLSGSQLREVTLRDVFASNQTQPGNSCQIFLRSGHLGRSQRQRQPCTLRNCNKCG